MNSRNLEYLLPILVCPNDKSPLTYCEFNKVEGVLICETCKEQYPIKDQIPIMLSAKSKTHRNEEVEISKQAQRRKWTALYEKNKERTSEEINIPFVVKRPLPNSLCQLLTIKRCLLETIKEGDVLLELGCGEGSLCERALNADAGSYIGLDISEVGVRKAFAKYHKALDLNFYFVVGDAEQLPFKGGYFDSCVSQWLFEHVPNPQASFKEIFRILKNGGRFYLDTNHRHFILTYRHFQKMLTSKKYKARMIEAGHDEKRFFEKAELEGDLKGLGFEIICSKLAYFLLDMFFDRQIAKIIRFFFFHKSKPKKVSPLKEGAESKFKDNVQKVVFVESRLNRFYNFTMRVIKFFTMSFDKLIELVGQGESVIVVAKKEDQ